MNRKPHMDTRATPSAPARGREPAASGLSSQGGSEDSGHPILSFVIPALNEEKLIPLTIGSIHRFVPPLRYEIIVVDHGSTDATARVASELGAVVIQQDIGTIGALRNAGVRKTRGDILVFLDADVVLTPEWAAQIASSIESIRREPHMLTGAWCSVPADASWLERWWFAPRIGKTHLGTGHMILARQFFDEIGGFNESLDTGEDYDLSRRAIELGGQILIENRLKVEHLGFPRTIGAFVQREAWHGSGDFSSLSVFVRSKVALATAAFVLLHGFFVVGLLTRSVGVLVAAGLGVTLICLASSYWKYQHRPVHVILHNAIVYWFYYVGRALALIPGVVGLHSSRSRS